MSRRLSRAARRLFEAGRLADAEKLYQRLLRAAPGDAVLLHNLSVAQYEQGRVPKAVETLASAINKDGTIPALYATMSAMQRHPDYQQYLKVGFSGPFNGQTVRQGIFREIMARTAPRAVFETGTFRGTTTEFMAGIAPGHVFSCEADPNYFKFARDRLAPLRNVSVFNRDSRSFLDQVVPLYARRGSVSFFYLDAHWDPDDLPLLGELQIVFRHAPHAVVMIDDFQVWDDPGYVYDDYGPGRTLTLDYLAPLAPLAPRCFFPVASDRESGWRRGSVVLTIDPALAEMLAAIPLLRPAEPPSDMRKTA